MTTNEEEITRDHELYLRHILLLGQAAPVGLNAIFEREVSKRDGGNLAKLIVEKKDIFKDSYNAEFLRLFQEDGVNTNIDYWDTLLLCVVILVLFKPVLTTTELEAIECISNQSKGLEKYANSASLSFNSFKKKWDTLHHAILTLIEDIDDGAKFECKRMIHSFESEPIRADIELINRMKQTNDSSQHVQMAIQDKVVPKIHGGDMCGKNEPTDHQYDTPVFTENLQDRCVYIDESAILKCKLSVSEREVMWRKESKPVEETDKLMVVNKKEMHWLVISHAKLTDSGHYSCICGKESTEAFLKISDKPLKIVESLHVATIAAKVVANEDIVLSCSVDRHTNESVWRHNGKVIEPCDRRHISVHELEHRLTIHGATCEDGGDYTVCFGDATLKTTLTIKGLPEFTENLHDTFVYVGEPTVLTCKLNGPDNTVKWRHDYQPIQETDNVKFLTDKCTHWLVISNAMLADTGHYSCSCGTASTTASLKVLDKPLSITKGLHIATVEADIREKMDIVLTCAVNLPTNKVIWRHDGITINPSNKHVISVQVLEHKLTIMGAQFEDEGDYTVAFGAIISSTNLKIKGNLNLLHKKQLTEDLYRNWIRGALGLKYLKLGLEGFADNSVKAHHVEIMNSLSRLGNVCTTCTADVLLPSHKQELCPIKQKCLCSKKPKQRKLCINGGFCSTFYDKILWDHRFKDPLLANTDVSNWSKEPWSVASCYISTTGYLGKLSAKEVDCSGLLSLFINNTFINRSLGDVEINGETDLFKQAKDVRNDILHNANYELSEGRFNDCIDLFKSVLEIKDINGNSPLSAQSGVQEAIDNLNELRNYQIDVRMSKDFQKQIEDLKEHSMNELAEKFAEAEMQNGIKHQQLTEQLKETERNLQLMRDLRSAEAKTKNSKVPFELELYIKALGSTGETSTKGNQRIYQGIKDYLSSHNSKAHTTSINATDQSIYRLLDFIISIKDCKISAVTEADTYTYIEIHSLTCEAIKEFLKLINGNEFRNETVELRKILERQEHIMTDDIIVSCSSKSLDNTKKLLCNRVPTNDFACVKHQGTQCTWYCSDHDRFCCSACKDSDHRTCVGIKQVVSERSYGIQKQSLIFKHKIGKYEVKIKNLLKNGGDNDDIDCGNTSICMLPCGSILLVDYCNKRLKKLDSSYNVISHCDMPDFPIDVCYIGDDRAAVSLCTNVIQFINVLGSMGLEQYVELDHMCLALACHGETLYVRDENTIYTYTRNCQQKHVVYEGNDLETDMYNTGIAVSDDGERIYITCATCLITIDKAGNHLFTLESDGLNDCLDVCVVGDGTVFVLDKAGSVYQVGYSGKQVLGTVLGPSDGLERSLSLCYGRHKCRVIVVNVEGEFVTVFNLKRHSSGEYTN